jgi:hypothetical protein
VTTSSSASSASEPISKAALRTGYVFTGLVSLFLAFDSVIKVLQLDIAVQATTALGYPVSTIVWIGAIELVCLGLYLVPRTAVLGALFLTGHLGGAIATHVRAGSPLASHTLFPIYVALLLWGGIYLREPRLRALLPLRS